MRNEKGQALVEFIVIFPVLMLIILGCVDFGNIIYKKYTLENQLDYYAELYESGKTNELDRIAKSDGVNYTIKHEDRVITLRVYKKIPVLTPGLSSILKSPYQVEASRVMYEQA